MDGTHLSKAKALFIEVAALPDDARRSFLDEQCGGDAALRRQVEALLRWDRDAVSDFLGGPGIDLRGATARDADDDPSDRMVGRRVGDFTIEGLVASGGMGSVYLAAQDQPHRTVALKLMRPGVASPLARRRFELEAQVLGRLRHPNIAQVYDAGTYDDGSGGAPYFAMEYVVGARSIIAHAEAEGLGMRDRLELFAKVCEAVHHGHQRGIIHRDLKPSNILVDEAGEPKIIDFGVARATDADIAVTTMGTDAGELVGTLAYMSPEQCAADADDLDTRSDVYGLGVVLYELLCYVLPYDVKHVPFTEAARVIREESPARPGTVNRALRGDVETIALKALEKDRERRYQSAADLGQDIWRYLRAKPIEARPPSMPYRLSRFARRHKPLVIGAATVLVVLLAGIIGTARGLLAEQSRTRQLEQVVEFQSSLFSGLDVAQMGERIRLDIIERRRSAVEIGGFDDAEVQRALLELEQSLEGVNFVDVAKRSLDENIFERALKEIDQEFAEQPLVQAELLQSIATVLRGLELPERAAPQERALEIRRHELGDEDRRTLRSLVGSALIDIERNRYEEAESSMRRVVETARRELGGEDPFTLWAINQLGLLLHWRDEYAESAECWSEVVEVGRSVLGKEKRLVMSAMGNLSFALDRLGDHVEAERLIRECLELRRRVLGEEHRSTLWASARLANMLCDQGRLGEAEPLARRVLAGYREARGNEHNRTLWAMNALADILRRTDQLEEAELLAAEAVEHGRALWANEHPPAGGRFLIGHGRVLTALERFESAETELLEALAMLEQSRGPVASRSFFERYVRELNDGFAELYAAWHAAQPEAGFEAKAIEVRSRIQAHTGETGAGDVRGPGT